MPIEDPPPRIASVFIPPIERCLSCRRLSWRWECNPQAAGRRSKCNPPEAGRRTGCSPRAAERRTECSPQAAGRRRECSLRVVGRPFWLLVGFLLEVGRPGEGDDG